MELVAFLALPVGSKVVVKRSGKVYELLSVAVRPQRDIETGLNEQYYATGRGLTFRQLRDGKLYGPLSHLKPANVKQLACQTCGAVGLDVKETVDPYEAEINSKDVPGVWCAKCVKAMNDEV